MKPITRLSGSLLIAIFGFRTADLYAQQRQMRPMMDIDMDGRISRAEFDQCFTIGDINGDGKLGFAETMGCLPFKSMNRRDAPRGRLDPRALRQRPPAGGKIIEPNYLEPMNLAGVSKRKALQAHDSNGNGFLEKGEYARCFGFSDKDGNGFIDQGESVICPDRKPS